MLVENDMPIEKAHIFIFQLGKDYTLKEAGIYHMPWWFSSTCETSVIIALCYGNLFAEEFYAMGDRQKLQCWEKLQKGQCHTLTISFLFFLLKFSL